jgi:hypothetical protein
VPVHSSLVKTCSGQSGQLAPPIAVHVTVEPDVEQPVPAVHTVELQLPIAVAVSANASWVPFVRLPFTHAGTVPIPLI